MFEVQFRSTSQAGATSRWSCYWATDDSRDASEYLRQLTEVNREEIEFRLVWVVQQPARNDQRQLVA